MKDRFLELLSLVYIFLVMGVMCAVFVVLIATPAAFFIWVVYLILKALGVFA